MKQFSPTNLAALLRAYFVDGQTGLNSSSFLCGFSPTAPDQRARVLYLSLSIIYSSSSVVSHLTAAVVTSSHFVTPLQAEKMERQAPYADHNVNPYSAAQMQQMAMQRMQLNAGMSNFAGRPDPYITEKEHRNISSKVEGQWQQDKNASIISNPMSPHLYGEGQGGSNAARSFYEGQMSDPKVDLEKQSSKESRLQTHEQDMEIGYGENFSSLNFEGLEQKFLDEIMQLAREQSDAEDAENARHMEKIMEINTRYQEKLSTLRARKAKRTDEFLLKESQARFHQYQQAGQIHHSTNAGPIDPRGYDGPAAAGETRRAYATSQYESSYRERPPFLRGGRNQETDARVSSFPEGRVFNNTGGRYY